MTTKETIINLADNFIRHKGYNAFSFYDISKSVGIKTASIHYHFPTKGDLGVAVIKEHIRKFEALKIKVAEKDSLKKMNTFFSIYSNVKADDNICLVGSLATDFHTVEGRVKDELKVFAGMVLKWVTEILEEGKAKKVFFFNELPRTKAILIITNMLAIVQLSRLTSDKDFNIVKKSIIKELTTR